MVVAEIKYTFVDHNERQIPISEKRFTDTDRPFLNLQLDTKDCLQITQEDALSLASLLNYFAENGNLDGYHRKNVNYVNG